MSYWADVMQDDVFIIAGGGWLAARDLREARKETDEHGKVKWLEEGDLTKNKVRLVADVIPPSLIASRFFPELKEALDISILQIEEIGLEIDELVEEHGDEDGLLIDALSETGKLTAASVKAREKSGEADAEELSLRKQAAKLIADEATAKKAAKEAEERLTDALLESYSTLAEQDIRILVIEDKWLSDITAAISTEVETRCEELTSRVRTLAERYDRALPEIMDDLAKLEEQVAGHLTAMGVAE